MVVSDTVKPLWCLALDLSTQSLKGIITNEKCSIVHEDIISFDRDLREFNTENGVDRHSDGCTITSPTLMWVKAVDMLLMKMTRDGINFNKIAMISGTAQQHGSVYWKKSANITLKHLDGASTLADQLQGCFAIEGSPVWMDSSTRKQCENLEQVIGGSEKLAEITGSKAYERFTGNQIAKIYETQKDNYRNCERISLISSFLASLFLNKYAQIDYSDGSGMNLLNINTKEWHLQLLSACAPGLSVRLGEPVPSTSILGNVSDYMISRYNFPSNCSVVAFTGDNPASLAGMRLTDGDIAVSLGTSDTLVFWTNQKSATSEGHVFVNPLDKSKFMALLCFKNGSLSREKVCKESCESSWDVFDEYLRSTPAGNGGKIAVHFDEMEILPLVQGVCRWNENNEEVDSFKIPAEEVRAIVEGQFLAKRYHAKTFGLVRDTNSRILATGGASQNTAILQILSDIFNLPVYVAVETKKLSMLRLCIPMSPSSAR